MVVPVNKIVKLQVTAADVLHAFALPSFGMKLDAIPGRLNETWFKAEREGTYYGQCSELCGNGHPYMPIVIRVVSEADYTAWLAEAKQKFAATSGAGDLKLAANAR
jgi:cytochrome c oxidase subunit 2